MSSNNLLWVLVAGAVAWHVYKHHFLYGAMNHKPATTAITVATPAATAPADSAAEPVGESMNAAAAPPVPKSAVSTFKPYVFDVKRKDCSEAKRRGVHNACVDTINRLDQTTLEVPATPRPNVLPPARSPVSFA